MLDLSTDLPKQYRYSYKAKLWAGKWRVDYELVGRHGGVHLHVSGPHNYDGEDHYSAGLEVHYRSPPEYMQNDPPSHDECWLLKCPCWHDGTSLYAQEGYLQIVLMAAHEHVFRKLASDADDYFAKARGEQAAQQAA